MKKLTRRDFLRLSAMTGAGVVAAACVPGTPVVVEKEVIKEVEVEKPVVVKEEVVKEVPVEKVVEKEVVKEVPVEKVVEKVVMATPLPVAEVEVMGFPRSETLIMNQHTGLVGSPSNFNEWVGWKNRDRGMQNLMNETLWGIDYVNGTVINALSTGLPDYNEDFTQVTFKLREGVYWSDGVEFTADDVVFTIETVRDTPGLNFHPEMKEFVKGVHAPDKYTVVIDLLKPNAEFNTFFLDRWGCLWIMPKHVFQPVAAKGAEALIAFEWNPPLSLGPYVLHSYDPGGFWTAWERRKDWERTPTGMLYGMPKPKYVIVKLHAGTAVEVIAQVRHELDAADMTYESLAAVLGANPFGISHLPDFPFFERGHPNLNGPSWCVLRPPFGNKDVRWALVLAIDIVSWHATAYDGTSGMAAIHLPNSPLFVEHYIRPLQKWLTDFTLVIDDGKEPATFKPYDPDMEIKRAEYAKARGFKVPEDREDLEAAVGLGWWKYAPDVAARLLEKHGFTRDKDGKWLLPDGTPWVITMVSTPVPYDSAYKVAFSTRREWERFGIEVEITTSEMEWELRRHGHYDILHQYPIDAPWGGHVSLWKWFNSFNTAYVEPVLGEITYGHPSRWSHPRMDEILDKMRVTDWGDTKRHVELGIEALKLLCEEMGPGIPTCDNTDITTWDTYYWTNWPTGENPYGVPHHHWPTFKFILPFLEPTGRKA